MSYPMTRLARKSDGHAHHASAAAGSDPTDQPDSLYVRLQIVEYKPLPTEELPVHIERGVRSFHHHLNFSSFFKP